MRLIRLRTGIVMSLRELFRTRIVVILLFLIPTLFYVIVALTATERLLMFKLAALSSGLMIEVSERSESLIFIGSAAVGLLTSYLALGMVQKHSEANRRLIICGFPPALLLIAKLAVLFSIMIIVGGYVAAMLPIFFRPERFLLVILGFVLIGYVYGCYGLIIGAVMRRELEGILFIVLLANIDAGWLQNPVYYDGAQNQIAIRILPAYFPTQVSMGAAFTREALHMPILGSLAYGTGFLIIALTIYYLRMQKR